MGETAGGGASAAGLGRGLVRELFQMDTKAEREKNLPSGARLVVDPLYGSSVLIAWSCSHRHLFLSGLGEFVSERGGEESRTVFYAVPVNASEPGSACTRRPEQYLSSVAWLQRLWSSGSDCFVCLTSNTQNIKGPVCKMWPDKDVFFKYRSQILV